jgi:CheY-like chemotaxis protein
MTANALADDPEQCPAAGMSDHIAKQIAPDLLIAKLRA